MAKKAEEATISHGQIYLAGDEMPDHVGKTTSKLNRSRRTTPDATHQGNRPGMSGSGQPQVEDIVDGQTGRITQPSPKEDKVAEKATTGAEKEAAKAEKRQEKADEKK